MLNFLGRDSPPTISNSSKLAARFEQTQENAAWTYISPVVMNTSPSPCIAIYVPWLNAGNPRSPSLPWSDRKNNCSQAPKVPCFLSFSNSAAGQPRDKLLVWWFWRKTTRDRKKRLKRKGNDEKKSKRKNAWHVSFQTSLVYQTRIRILLLFSIPSIFLRRNDLCYRLLWFEDSFEP